MNEDLNTRLHHASLNGHLTIVKCLVKNYKCDPLAIPLYFAGLEGHSGVAEDPKKWGGGGGGGGGLKIAHQ